MPSTFLYTHNERFSKYDIIVNPEFLNVEENDLVEIEQKGKCLVLQVKGTNNEALYQNLKISLASHIANLFQFQARNEVFVRKIFPSNIFAEYCELTFKDQHVSRADMFRLKLSLLYSSLYVGQKLSLEGSIRAQVKRLYANGTKSLSGYIHPETKFIFRSESVRYFIFIQISQDMFEFEDNGYTYYEKMFLGFLPELFHRWKTIGCNHVVTIILFARVLYTEAEYYKRYPDTDPPLSFSGIGIYKDFYRVVFENESRSDWMSALLPLKEEVAKFKKFVLLDRCKSSSVSQLLGTLAHSLFGNVLETINLTLNLYECNAVDKDLFKTGSTLAVITPGTGRFKADEKLLRLTNERMLETGLSMDLICLSRPPLHCVPLFELNGMEGSLMFKGELSERCPPWIDISFYDVKMPFHEKGFLSRCKIPPFSNGIHIEDILEVFQKDSRAGVAPLDKAAVKEPKNISLGTNLQENLPKFKMEASEPSKFENFSRTYDIYDESGFSTNLSKKQTKENVGLLSRVFASSHDNSKNEGKVSGSNEVVSSDMVFPKSYKSDEFLKSLDCFDEKNKTKDESIGRSPDDLYSEMILLGTRNSSNFQNVSNKPGSDVSKSFFGISPTRSFLKSRRPHDIGTHGKGCAYISKPISKRWQHVQPRNIKSQGNNLEIVKWTSLCSPACMPLTTDFFPSSEELANEYKEYTYTLSFNEESPSLPFDSNTVPKAQNLLLELVSQRLIQGFQVVSFDKPADGINSFTVMGPQGRVTSNAFNGPSLQDFNSMPNRAIFSNFSVTEETSPYYLMSGNQCHRLLYDSIGQNVEVKRYVKKFSHERHPYTYKYTIWSKNNIPGTLEISFDYPALESINWNYLDHVVSGYYDELTDNIKYWKSRFVLLPLEPGQANSSFVNPSNETLTEEEVRVAGFMKFVEVFSKACISNDQPKFSNTEISIITLSPSAYVSNDLNQLQYATQLEPEPYLKKRASGLERTTSKLSTIANALQNPSLGLIIKDRRWHLRLYEKVIVGHELVDWFIKHFSDIETREEAEAYGNELCKKGFLKHVNGKHTFLDGHYFYRINSEFIQISKDDKATSSRWFRSKEKNGDEEFSRVLKKIELIKKHIINLDNQKKGTRKEVATLYYDALYNPQNAYHFEIHWLLCTTRLLEDLIQSWSRTAEKCGFRIIQTPVCQKNNSQNPFQSLKEIIFCVTPPEVNVAMKSTPFYYEIELIKKFGYICDVESSHLFPVGNAIVPFLTKSEFSQYVHRTGTSFIELRILGRLHWFSNFQLNNTSKNIGMIDSIRIGLETFCSDENALKEFWKTCSDNVMSQSKEDIIDDDAKKSQKLVFITDDSFNRTKSQLFNSDDERFERPRSRSLSNPIFNDEERLPEDKHDGCLPTNT